jgi:hypothetical protein
LIKNPGPAWYANPPWLYNIVLFITLIYPVYWCAKPRSPLAHIAPSRIPILLRLRPQATPAWII